MSADSGTRVIGTIADMNMFSRQLFLVAPGGWVNHLPAKSPSNDRWLRSRMFTHRGSILIVGYASRPSVNSNDRCCCQHPVGYGPLYARASALQAMSRMCIQCFFGVSCDYEAVILRAPNFRLDCAYEGVGILKSALARRVPL